MDWEDRLADWEVELELTPQLEGSDWVTLERAAAGTGVSRAALRSWYRTGQIPSRLVDGPHGPHPPGAPPAGPGRRAPRRGLAAAAQHRAAAARRRGPAGDPPPPGRPARAQAGRARSTGPRP